jgi:hypothetical protein
MTRYEMVQQQLESSVDALMRAALREIDHMMRKGATLEEILKALRTFRLPPGEALKLKNALDAAMNDITDIRGSVVKQLSSADILTIKAASQLSFPKLQSAVQKTLIPAVQKAIAAKSGPTVLMHQLKKDGFDRPKTLALTSLSQFNNELTFTTAEVTGTKKFLYSGPVVAATRSFCREHAGKVYTLAEIEKMDNGQGISVRSSCGGYRCRHHWLAAPDEGK